MSLCGAGKDLACTWSPLYVLQAWHGRAKYVYHVTCRHNPDRFSMYFFLVGLQP